jgi:hypothetical protein
MSSATVSWPIIYPTVRPLCGCRTVVAVVSAGSCSANPTIPADSSDLCICRRPIGSHVSIAVPAAVLIPPVVADQ